ncbi:MAG TPA: hypoxanthine phosphoribosyltransferase, partial [Candidatus Hydrogenedentes bacterium]|nr:hypoxanthine phosphoribosyltransferase [Candidatus Hydrogenedentota bacterium]
RHPGRIEVCALLDKPSRRRVDIEADFAGMVIGDHFVVGYGLDYEQQGRQHPGIGILNAAD